MTGRSRQDVPPVLQRRIYEVVAAVPAGKVSTYGDIASIVGGGCDARTVGYALNALPKREAAPDDGAAGEAPLAPTPWQRIINARGGISTAGLLQRKLLEDEGVAFDAEGNVPLGQFRWEGPASEWATEHGFNVLPARGGDDGEQLSLF